MGTALPIRMTKGLCSARLCGAALTPCPGSPCPPVQQCDGHELLVLANPHVWVSGGSGGEDHAASRGLFSLLLSPICVHQQLFS